ncbi:1-acyl-sn-glycerol-3-phosphate acyltransferase [SAR86 cluster bacterium]|jgi:1-acyl-sn-glycerol-3-phosphate acyltransferase|nr:1-acyl-sn-glycerol-3-phosphate acyltransferase [SAR86 cluster bacterium]
MKLNEIKKTIVPEIHRANRSRFIKWIGRIIQKFSGWQVEGEIPNLKKFVLVGGPHTSNWDFVHALGVIWSLDLKMYVLAKNSLFKVPILKKIMYGVGGIPVNRDNPQLIVDKVSQLVAKEGGVIIGITPEGTRSKVDRWKTGFLRIAKQMDCKIALISIDFEKKMCSFNGFFEPSGDNEQDINNLKLFYSGFKAKHPENF